MTLRSAKHDLRETTLRALPSALARLEYLASLRTPEGEYEHWGLARVYGAEEAQRVLLSAHREALDDVLRLSLQDLYAEAESEPERFEREASELLPPPTTGLREAHFNLVWDVLRNVARRRGSRRAA